MTWSAMTWRLSSRRRVAFTRKCDAALSNSFAPISGRSSFGTQLATQAHDPLHPGDEMPNFSQALGLAIMFAAMFAFIVEPVRKSGKDEERVRPVFRSEQPNGADYEAIFLFSLLGLLVTCVFLPHLRVGPLSGLIG
jgi:hypothetical protein